MNFLWYVLGVALALMFGPLAGTMISEATAPPPPIYRCDSLTAARTPFDPNEVVFTTNATVMNGATIVGYAYDFGDGIVGVSNGLGATINHPYGEPGVFTATVKIKVELPGGGIKSITSPDCRTTVQVVETP